MTHQPREPSPRLQHLLSDSLTQRGIEQWLRAPNRLLDGQRPLDLLERGEDAAVEEAARAFIDGAYT